VAQWLVKNGAKHLVLMGRSGAASPATQSAVKALEEAGAKVIVAKADVSQALQVTNVLTDIKRSMQPLRGIIHAANVVDDAVLLQLNRERFQKVMAPKVMGAWNLHALSLNAPLDFFINFSSFASVVGNPGQGNYVAASAFLDALAHHRRAMDLPVLTVNWGAITDVGYVAQNAEVGEHLGRIGIKPLLSHQAISVLGELLLLEAVQTGVIAIDWQRWCQFHLAGALPRFSHLAGEEAISEEPVSSNNKEDSLHNALIAAEPAERQQLLESRLCGQVARVLRTSAAKLDNSTPLTNLGLDSLMAVELSNRIKSQLGADVPTMKLMMGSLSISQLAVELLEQMISVSSTAVASFQTSSNSSSATAATNWIVFPKPNPNTRLRLFCFPYNGGTSSIFLPWSEGLPPDIEVCIIQLPGQIDRPSEKHFEQLATVVEKLAEVLLPYLDKPFAFYGHSIGGTIAFELARQLRREYNLSPAHLFVGASPAPQLPYPYPSVVEIYESERNEQAPFSYLVESVQQNTELIRFLLPGFKAGSLMLENYVYSDEEPLVCPISVFGGMQDNTITQKHLSAWHEQTRSHFKLQIFPGNHLFMHGDQKQLLEVLSHELIALLNAPVK
jgi:surfactin synthase thioesterase subunit/short-subunit dehydrogenase/acyl carrier protein